MPTPAQEHFKNEMKQLKQDGYLNKESIYHPIKRKKSNRPWWSYSLIGIILFIITFSSIPAKIYNDVIVHKDEKIYAYLETSEKYDEQSDTIIRNNISQVQQLSTLQLSKLQQEKEEVNRLIVETDKIKTPSAFKSHKEAVIDVMQQRLFILTYLEVLLKKGSPYSGELNSHINELNTKQEMARSILITTFEEENIEYTIQTDGTIHYKIKSYLPKTDS